MRLISYIASSTSVPGDVLKKKRIDTIIDSIQHPPPGWAIAIIPLSIGVFWEYFPDFKIGLSEVIFKLLIVFLIYILGCVLIRAFEDKEKRKEI